MDAGMFELIEKILHGVSFIALGGTVAIVFFFVFAPSILGSKTTHRQLEKLQEQAELMHRQLERIAEHLERSKDDSAKKP